jgi:hypothetical protein
MLAYGSFGDTLKSLGPPQMDFGQKFGMFLKDLGELYPTNSDFAP